MDIGAGAKEEREGRREGGREGVRAVPVVELREIGQLCMMPVVAG